MNSKYNPHDRCTNSEFNRQDHRADRYFQTSNSFDKLYSGVIRLRINLFVNISKKQKLITRVLK